MAEKKRLYITGGVLFTPNIFVESVILPTKTYLLPGTLNNQFFMDVWFFPTISQVKVWNHPTETTILKWMFRVPGIRI